MRHRVKYIKGNAAGPPSMLAQTKARHVLLSSPSFPISSMTRCVSFRIELFEFFVTELPNCDQVVISAHPIDHNY